MTIIKVGARAQSGGERGLRRHTAARVARDDDRRLDADQHLLRFLVPVLRAEEDVFWRCSSLAAVVAGAGRRSVQCPRYAGTGRHGDGPRNAARYLRQQLRRQRRVDAERCGCVRRDGPRDGNHGIRTDCRPRHDSDGRAADAGGWFDNADTRRRRRVGFPGMDDDRHWHLDRARDQRRFGGRPGPIQWCRWHACIGHAHQRNRTSHHTGVSGLGSGVATTLAGTPIYARAYNAVAQAITTATLTAVGFDAEAFKSGVTHRQRDQQ